MPAKRAASMLPPLMISTAGPFRLIRQLSSAATGTAAAPSAIDAILLLPQAIFYLASIAGFVYMMISAYKWETVQIPIIGEQVE